MSTLLDTASLAANDTSSVTSSNPGVDNATRAVIHASLDNSRVQLRTEQSPSRLACHLRPRRRCKRPETRLMLPVMRTTTLKVRTNYHGFLDQFTTKVCRLQTPLQH